MWILPTNLHRTGSKYFAVARRSEDRRCFVFSGFRRWFCVSPRKPTASLWEQFFRDPSQFHDLRNVKKCHNSPDFQHRCTGKVLWIDGHCNPPWVQAKLRRVEPAHIEVNMKNNRAGIIELIKSSGKKKDISMIMKIYGDKSYVMNDIVIANTLIRSLARCGAMKIAQKVFDQLTEPDIISWTALIAGYVEQGFGKEAIVCFKAMQKSQVSPDSVTYTCALKACAVIGALALVREIHACIKRHTLMTRDIMLGNTLINTYAKCGALTEAQEVFEQILEPDVVSWNALIAGYADQDFAEKALECFRKMQRNKVAPNSVTYTCALKACAITGSADMVDEIHASMQQQTLVNKDITLGNTLVNAYARCGAVKKAREVFDQLKEPNIVSWTALIAGYAEQGFSGEAIVCFKEMRRKAVKPDAITYICTLKACANVGAIEVVEEIHGLVRQQALLNKNIVLGNTLVNAYARCGALKEAQEVFEQLAEPDIVSWNALIAGYVDQGFGEEALVWFQKMPRNKLSPNSATYICVLKACAIVGSVSMVEKIHNELKQLSLLRNNIDLESTLVGAYARCGAVKQAQEVFEQLLEPDVVSWNALIAGYVEHEFGEEALVCFGEMQRNKVKPNSVTFICSLKACAMVGAIETVDEIHTLVRHRDLLYKNNVLGNSLVNAYARCGAVKEAQEVFKQLTEPDVVSWTALIAGYVEKGYGEEALVCFIEMLQKPVAPNSVTFTCALKACAIVGAVDIVEEIHEWVRQQALLKDTVLGNSLVNAYARCGAVKKAQEVFEKLEERDIVGWTAVMAGYAKIGCVNEMLEIFNRMMSSGIFPGPVTLHVLLNGCSHGALMEEGVRLFSMTGMQGGYVRTAEHYACMVDMYGRAGWLDEARRYVRDDTSTLMAYLGACQKWVEVEDGRWAFEGLLELDEKCAGVYVSMSNLCAAAAAAVGRMEQGCMV